MKKNHPHDGKIRRYSDRIRSATNSVVITRPGGEIGRHKRLKISRLYGRAGSIPAPGTKLTPCI